MAELTFYTSKYQGEEVDKVIEQIQEINFPKDGSSSPKIIVPIANGGIGAEDGAKGLENLFAAGSTILSGYQYGVDLPSEPKEGQLFFQQANDLATFGEVARLLYPIGTVFFTTSNLDETNGPNFGDNVIFTWVKIGSFSIGDTTVYAWRRTA